MHEEWTEHAPNMLPMSIDAVHGTRMHTKYLVDGRDGCDTRAHTTESGG